jgi:PAS domain S-box-containing protein
VPELPPPDELQALLAAVVTSSDDAIVSKNLNGIVQSWNVGAERIFGWRADEMIGQSITKIIPPERQEEEPKILERLRRGERVDHFQTVRIRKDGRRIDVSVTISPVRRSDGTIVGASKIARDVTEQLAFARERDELLAAERAARAEAERVSRMKDEFLATLSHELRTPLNAIVGWADLLRRSGNDEGTIREGLEVIDRNARAQTQLIADLLDMSRIVAGKIRLDVQRVSLAPIVEAAVAAVRPAADVKNVDLRTILDPLAGPVSGDPARLQQVVWNLLTNAIKFTPARGKVTVQLERVNSHIEVTVSDTGQGIKPEFLPHVFERFRQADASTTRHHGGLGIGLAIVRHLVELHGGRVRARSGGDGQGATFSVELPVAPVAAPEAAREHPSAEVGSALEGLGVSLKGVRLLVVDDEPDARGLLRRVLEESGATVELAESADAALRSLAGGPPDVLVSDIGMPGKDGYQLIREARKVAGCERLPAVALTAFARSTDRTRALLAGYQVHVAKPVEPQELVVTIASLVGIMS